MSMNHKIETLLSLLDEYKALGIADLIKSISDPITECSIFSIIQFIIL